MLLLVVCKDNAFSQVFASQGLPPVLAKDEHFVNDVALHLAEAYDMSLPQLETAASKLLNKR